MPPALPTESDAESAAEEVPQSKPESVAVQPDEEIPDAPEVSKEEEDDEDDDDDEELYVVEKIISHNDAFGDGEIRYEVKWQGYEKKQDRTWESEDNLEGAREVLEAYWESIGGKPVPTPKQPKSTGKKRGRQSTGSTKPAKKPKKAGRKSASAAQDYDDDEGSPDGPVGFTNVNSDTWIPPKPDDNAWDPLVMNVDTIEKDDKGELWAYLVWNEKNDDDRFNRSKARLATCNKACPQRMLQFYEKHVYVCPPPLLYLSLPWLLTSPNDIRSY
ncbi:MAG: hypothetical protein L6R40_001383 [Gallowayella cf. fulva]|nr:MAG: hypothetical protein L6R40_001383 [Xanthomendoza cf. fulva]